MQAFEEGDFTAPNPHKQDMWDKSWDDATVSEVIAQQIRVAQQQLQGPQQQQQQHQGQQQG